VRILFYYRGIENLGVGYLMSAVRSAGHEIDLIFDPGLDDNLFLKAPHLAWMNRHEEMLDRAKAFNPDLVAMGSLTNLWPFASKMAEKLKQALGKPILVGGHHAQALPDYILQNPNVDMACIGEGGNDHWVCLGAWRDSRLWWLNSHTDYGALFASHTAEAFDALEWGDEVILVEPRRWAERFRNWVPLRERFLGAGRTAESREATG
jgi:hypothetical protein